MKLFFDESFYLRLTLQTGRCVRRIYSHSCRANERTNEQSSTTLVAVESRVRPIVRLFFTLPRRFAGRFPGPSISRGDRDSRPCRVGSTLFPRRVTMDHFSPDTTPACPSCPLARPRPFLPFTCYLFPTCLPLFLSSFRT